MADGKRIAAASLKASLALIAALALQEGYDRIAKRPVPHDPLTYGHGATVRADGKPVQAGDTITRTEARALLQKQVADTYEAEIRRCAGDVPMTQGEYDATIDLAYNIGAGKVCRSTMLHHFRAGEYAAGCEAIMLFDRLHGVRCSLPENRNRRDGCRGILARRAAQIAMCKG